MKFNFKKISAIGASILMTGLTAGVAAAANFPAPFVANGVANVAVVYGTGVGVSSLDQVQAGNIQTTLGEAMPSTGTTTTIDGESYKFEKTSTKFHLGDHFVNITTTVDDDEAELPTLLADGKYIDDDKDEFDYTQKITMGSLGQLTMFDDNDYAEDSPTVGFRIPSAQTILTYTLTFSDTPLMTDMPTSDLPIMGKSYYVLSNTTTTLTLLDSATEDVLSEGETASVGGKTVSIEYIDADEVKLNIDGEVTASLAEAQTQKLADGSYVGIKDILYSTKEGTIGKVEFSVGTGKLKLTDGDIEVQINDDTISGLESDFSLTANVLTNIELTWKADDDSFIAEDSELTMPGFGIVKLSYGGLTYPTEEVIEVTQGGDTYARLDNFPLKDGEADIDFLYGNSTWFTAIGKDANNLLRTDDNADGNITFDKDTDAYFIASWTDTKDAESYMMRANSFTTDSSSVDRVDIEYYKDGAWTTKKSGAKATDTISIGNIDLTLGAVSNSANTVEIWNTSANSATSITSFNTLYSKEGLTVYLPYLNTSAIDYNTGNATFTTAVAACNWAQVEVANAVGEFGYGGVVTYNSTASATAVMASATTTCAPEATTFTLKMVEEDRSENKYSGDTINLTIGWDSSSVKEVEVSDIVGEEVSFTEIGETDVWRSFMYSALATEILWNKPSSGQKSVKLMYHGDEVAADVYITSADATITSNGASALGDVLVTDAEINNVKDKNLIIVGGSCINSAAATVLGGAYCGAAFTSATGVGAGQFLIKSYDGAFTTGKIALVVAGYEAADTVNAATYLRTKTVDTSKGYIGTSSTAAELIVA